MSFPGKHFAINLVDDILSNDADKDAAQTTIFFEQLPSDKIKMTMTFIFTPNLINSESVQKPHGRKPENSANDISDQCGIFPFDGSPIKLLKPTNVTLNAQAAPEGLGGKVFFTAEVHTSVVKGELG